MSERDVKKPETRDDFLKMLTEAVKKELETRGIRRGKPKNLQFLERLKC